MTDSMLESIKDQRADICKRIFNKSESELNLDERMRIDQEIPGWGLAKTGFSLVPLVEVSMGGTRVRNVDSKIEYRVYTPMKNGYHSYPFVVLKSKKYNKAYKASVHQFVADAFVKKIDGKEFVNHLDSDPWNNSYTNIEWCTQSENVRYSVDRGKRKTGENAPNAVYTDAQIHHVCQLLQDHPELPYPKISELTGVSIATIDNIYNGIARLDISRLYTFPKKEYLRGENHWNSIYSDGQIRLVCQILSDEKYAAYTFAQIEEISGVDKQTIGDIFRKHTRLDISSQYEFCERQTSAKGENNGNAKFSDKQAEKVCCLLDGKIMSKNKLSQSAIGQLTGTNRSFVCDIWNGRERVYVAKNHYFYQQKFGMKEDVV